MEMAKALIGFDVRLDQTNLVELLGALRVRDTCSSDAWSMSRVRRNFRQLACAAISGHNRVREQDSASAIEVMDALIGMFPDGQLATEAFAELVDDIADKKCMHEPPYEELKKRWQLLTRLQTKHRVPVKAEFATKLLNPVTHVQGELSRQHIISPWQIAQQHLPDLVETFEKLGKANPQLAQAIDEVPSLGAKASAQLDGYLSAGANRKAFELVLLALEGGIPLKSETLANGKLDVQLKWVFKSVNPELWDELVDDYKLESGTSKVDLGTESREDALVKVKHSLVDTFTTLTPDTELVARALVRALCGASNGQRHHDDGTLFSKLTAKGLTLNDLALEMLLKEDERTRETPWAWAVMHHPWDTVASLMDKHETLRAAALEPKLLLRTILGTTDDRREQENERAAALMQKGVKFDRPLINALLEGTCVHEMMWARSWDEWVAKYIKVVNRSLGKEEKQEPKLVQQALGTFFNPLLDKLPELAPKAMVVAMQCQCEWMIKELYKRPTVDGLGMLATEEVTEYFSRPLLDQAPTQSHPLGSWVVDVGAETSETVLESVLRGEARKSSFRFREDLIKDNDKLRALATAPNMLSRLFAKNHAGSMVQFLLEQGVQLEDELVKRLSAGDETVWQDVLGRLSEKLLPPLLEAKPELADCE